MAQDSPGPACCFTAQAASLPQIIIVIYLSVVGALLLYMAFLMLVDPLIRKPDAYTEQLHNEEENEVNGALDLCMRVPRTKPREPPLGLVGSVSACCPLLPMLQFALLLPTFLYVTPLSTELPFALPDEAEIVPTFPDRWHQPASVYKLGEPYLPVILFLGTVEVN